MNLDFKTLDKSTFECLKLSNDHVYFGKTKLMHSETKELRDQIDDIEEEEEKEKYVKVRHGPGIQLYSKNAQGVQCKYAGEWVMDEKSGDAHVVYPDGSEFKGNVVKGVFNGKGKYWWPVAKTGGSSNERHTYLGEWQEGKMQGKGEFKHAIQGHNLKGYFAKNLFVEVHQGKKYYLNPLDTKE